MKKTVWTFGLISGAILSVMMMVTLPFHDQIGFDRSLVVGYTTIVVAFLLIFTGIKAYRDRVGAGQLSFGRAFSVGALIAVIASVCYVATWQVVYFNFMPDYLQKYQAHVIEKEKAGGATQAELDKKMAEMRDFEQMYQNPLVNAGFTLLEPLPVGLIIALISAGVLTRGRGSGGVREESRAAKSFAA
jgi:hypothetical protein